MVDQDEHRMNKKQQSAKAKAEITQIDALLFKRVGKLLWQIAEAGYAQYGRGAVLVDMQKGRASVPPSEYVYRKALSEWQQFSSDAAHMVETYEPDRQMVVILIGRVDKAGDKTVRTHLVRRKELIA